MGTTLFPNILSQKIPVCVVPMAVLQETRILGSAPAIHLDFLHYLLRVCETTRPSVTPKIGDFQRDHGNVPKLPDDPLFKVQPQQQSSGFVPRRQHLRLLHGRCALRQHRHHGSQHVQGCLKKTRSQRPQAEGQG